MDHVGAVERSAIMAAVKSSGSKPEMALRRILHGAGYRYALHRADLPGKPDLVFAPRRKIVFVHGCFWHRHGCRYTTTPKTRTRFWEEKFAANVVRDRRVRRALRAMGWQCLVVWQCQLKDIDKVRRRAEEFLERR